MRLVEFAEPFMIRRTGWFRRERLVPATGASVIVNHPDGRLARVFHDPAGATVLMSPLTVGNDGRLNIWLSPGWYTFTISGPDIQTTRVTMGVGVE